MAPNHVSSEPAMNLRAVNAIAPDEQDAGTFHDGHAAPLQAFLHQRALWLRGLGPLLCCVRAGRIARAVPA
ncbi:hypothetical protein [Metallibacterium scheffleri]